MNIKRNNTKIVSEMTLTECMYNKLHDRVKYGHKSLQLLYSF